MRNRVAGFRFVLWTGVSLLFAPVSKAASSQIGTLDPAPAATLLLPYFEVDLADPDGVNTLFSINNASASAVLAHMVVWSDLSVPVLDFNLYLTGYDIQSINLRDILVNARLPQTASQGQDPADTISPKGDFSQDVNFGSCTGLLPPPELPRLLLDHLQSSLTGHFSSLLGGCAGLSLQDRIARGYVTVDTVSSCTLRFPGDPGYFAPGGRGDATDDNVLWGDYFYVKPGTHSAAGYTLVHIQADASDPRTSIPGQYTFYGRYVNWTAADNREPLATNFAVRYLTGGAFSRRTDLLVWRDSKVSQGAFPCGTLPDWFWLGQEKIVVFDEQEQSITPLPPPVSPPPPPSVVPLLAAEAQRIQLGGVLFPLPYDAGWIYLDLNTVVPAAGANPPTDPLAAQAWVSTEMTEGRFSIGLSSVKLDSATRPLHGATGLFEPEDPLAACGRDTDGDGVPDCFDCRPHDATVYRGAPEIACDGLINDCSTLTAPIIPCFFIGDLVLPCFPFYIDLGPHSVTCPEPTCHVPECNGIRYPTHPFCPDWPNGTPQPGFCDMVSDDCRQAACQDGSCNPKAIVLSSGSSCDDHNPCTTDDRCDATGKCVGTPLETGATPFLCSGTAGTCKHHCCQAGVCGVCNDADNTSPSSCNTPDPRTCTQAACLSGECKTSAPRRSGSCTEGITNPCTTGMCSSTAKCVPKAVPGRACPDEGNPNPCTNDICDASGECTHPCKGEGVDGCHTTCFSETCTNTAKCFLFYVTKRTSTGFTCVDISGHRYFASSEDEARRCATRDAEPDTCSTLTADPRCSCEAPPPDLCAMTSHCATVVGAPICNLLPP